MSLRPERSLQTAFSETAHVIAALRVAIPLCSANIRTRNQVGNKVSTMKRQRLVDQLARIVSGFFYWLRPGLGGSRGRQLPKLTFSFTPNPTNSRSNSQWGSRSEAISYERRVVSSGRIFSLTASTRVGGQSRLSRLAKVASPPTQQLRDEE